jgi:hypothetical protein
MKNKDLIENNNSMQIAIDFAEWITELLPPEYTMDIRRRFTPQVKAIGDNELFWIETHKCNSSDPKFYTTKEVFEMWLNKDK